MGGLSGELLAALQTSVSGAAGSFRSEHAFLVLEHLELRGYGDYAALGRSLAAVHSVHGETFGWHRDNYIGRTPQLNRRSASWSDFWREARLGPQLDLARKKGFGKSLLR